VAFEKAKNLSKEVSNWAKIRKQDLPNIKQETKD